MKHLRAFKLAFTLAVTLAVLLPAAGCETHDDHWDRDYHDNDREWRHDNRHEHSHDNVRGYEFRD